MTGRDRGIELGFVFDEGEQGLADVFAGGGVVEDGGAASCGERGEDRGLCTVADGIGFGSGGEGEGKLIDVGLAFSVGDLEEDDGGGGAGKFDPVEDAHAGDGAGFCAEPALADEVCGQMFLDEAEPRAGEQIRPGSGDKVEGRPFGLYGGGLRNRGAGWSSSQRKEYGARVRT